MEMLQFKLTTIDHSGNQPQPECVHLDKCLDL